jgi:hypothetical protein
VARWSGAVLAAVLIAALSGQSAAQSSATCVGDCDGDGRVRINELILGLQVELGARPSDACPAIDCEEDLLAINCMVVAVHNALAGCGIPCGDTVCPPPEYCCNPLLSICAPPGVACIQ